MLQSKPELLAPAGNWEKLEFAFAYGADAAYLGGKRWNLRSFGGNFSDDELARAMDYAHARGKKIYVTVNVYPRNGDFVELGNYLRFLASIGTDAILVADLGVFMLAREVAPTLNLHISTQANTINFAAVNAWRKLGATRVVLARELSEAEIADIRRHTDTELEMFIHGAMCMAYSGRCLLSAYMTGDEANAGACRQPCRWNYSLVEQKRPNEYFPIREDENGSYIFNSKDLSLMSCIKSVLDTGVNSLKIEGRMKSVHYLATVVKAYRQAIDDYFADSQNFSVRTSWLEELEKVSHREYWTGFFKGEDTVGQIYGNSSYVREAQFVGIVTSFDETTNWATVEQRGKMSLGQTIEVLQPQGENFSQTIHEMTDENGIDIKVAPHARQIVKIRMNQNVLSSAILRVL